MIEDSGNPSKIPDVDVLIITALREEQTAFLDALGEYKTIDLGDSTIGTLHHVKTTSGKVYDVVLVTLPNMGNVDAGIQSISAINVLQPNYLIMAGIAGGVKSKISLGDILVADQIIYYSQSKHTPDGLEIRPRNFPTDPYLLQAAQLHREINWGPVLSDEGFKDKSAVPKVHFGPILAGEEVVADAAYMHQLLNLNPKIMGIEMESYGAGRAAFSSSHHTRFITFRCMCDYADDAKDDSWHSIACKIAATYTVSFIHSGLLEKTPGKNLKEGFEYIVLRHFSQKTPPRHLVTECIETFDPNAQIFDVPLLQQRFIKDGLPTNSEIIRNTNLSAAKKIDRLSSKHSTATLCYFGIAHIPLLFHLGFLLSNKQPIRFFEYDRYSQIWAGLGSNDANTKFSIEGMPSQLVKNVGDIVIRISISNTISLDDLPQITNKPIIDVHAHLEKTMRDAIVSYAQLLSLGKSFRTMMDSIHELTPNRKTTHIFYAGPASLAVYFGQLLHAGIDRNIKVYNYTPSHSPRYSWGLDIA